MGLLLILYSIHKTATDRRLEMLNSSTSPARKLAQMTTLSKSQRFLRKPWSVVEVKSPEALHQERRIMQCSSGLLKIPSLWEAALETERRCVSKVILSSNVTPKISRSTLRLYRLLQNSATQSYWERLGMHGAWPEDYHCLSLARMHSCSIKVNNQLTLLRSLIRNSATTILSSG